MNKTLSKKDLMRSQLVATGLLSSALALQLISSWKLYMKSIKVALYLSMSDEVNVDELLDSEKQTYLPRFENGSYVMAEVKSKNDLIPGKYGILEPSSDCPIANPGEIDLWLVPGRAFDAEGNRLGRGRGFYDRLLQGESGVKLGLPPDGKLYSEVPAEEWDIKMDFLLLEDGVKRV